MTKQHDYMTWQQGAEIARQLHELKKAQRKSTRAAADLRHAAVDGGSGIRRKDADGRTVWQFGDQGIEHVGGEPPSQPSVPFVDVGPRVVKVQHSGLDVEEDPAPEDLRHAQVHVSQDPEFEPSLSTFATNLDTVNGSVTHSLSAGEWWVGIVWVTLSNQRSAMSETVLADIPAPVDAQDIQDTLDEAQARLDKYNEDVAQPRFQALEDGLEQNTTNLSDARSRLSAAEQTLAPLPTRGGR